MRVIERNETLTRRSFDEVVIGDYYLMHQDDIVMLISFDTHFVRHTVYIEELVPYYLKGADDNGFNVTLTMWIANRGIDRNRIFRKEIFESINLKPNKTSASYMLWIALQYNATSIRDSYWMKPVESKLTWSQVTLIGNNSSNDEFETGVMGRPMPSILDKFVNTLSTEGISRKYWLCDKGIMYLYKVSDNPVVEANATTILKEFYNNAVFYCYDLSTMSSICMRINCTDLIEWWEYKHFLLTQKSEITTVQFLMETYPTSVADMVIADFIIGNESRTDYDFGLYRNDDLSLLDFAPLWDFDKAFTMDRFGFNEPSWRKMLNIIYLPLEMTFLYALKWAVRHTSIDVERINIGSIRFEYITATNKDAIQFRINLVRNIFNNKIK